MKLELCEPQLSYLNLGAPLCRKRYENRQLTLKMMEVGIFLTSMQYMENHSKNRWVFLALGISTRRILQIKGRVRRGANPGYKIGDNKHGPPVFVIWMFWKTLGTWRKHPIYPILVIVSRESRLFGVPTPNIGNAVKMGQDGSRWVKYGKSAAIPMKWDSPSVRNTSQRQVQFRGTSMDKTGTKSNHLHLIQIISDYIRIEIIWDKTKNMLYPCLSIIFIHHSALCKSIDLCLICALSLNPWQNTICSISAWDGPRPLLWPTRNMRNAEVSPTPAPGRRLGTDKFSPFRRMVIIIMVSNG